VAEAMRHEVATVTLALPHAVTVSIGVASFPAHGSTRDELLGRADAAMYASKRGGKNRASIAGEPTPRSHMAARREISLGLLHTKDRGTANHSIVVSILSIEVARRLGLAADRLEDLRTAARLHDLGKLGIPSAILNKPGALDDDEFRIVKTHPIVGAELLNSWGLPGPGAIVRQHHERIDGEGYPHGLRGEEIRLEARIIHVADAYTAMMHDRPYRGAMGRDDAFAELTAHAGTQFDADVVAALIAVERLRPAGRPGAAGRQDPRVSWEAH
jgi:two-component system cell cycle response regulator